MGGGSARWLLIGNSRWHWVSGCDGVITSSDGAPAEAPVAPPVAWAAVGPVPVAAALPPERRLQLADVPLAAVPPWLGIDRALAGWQAWTAQAGPVLVADAGTVLSLTRVDGAGGFAGGRLMAGMALQWRAMAGGTAALPGIDRPESLAGGGPEAEAPAWPRDTAAAMVQGVRRGLAAAVLAAGREAARLEPGLTLVLTGGDGEALAPLIAAALGPEDPALLLRPTLCLEALMALRPLRPGRDP